MPSCRVKNVRISKRTDSWYVSFIAVFTKVEYKASAFCLLPSTFKQKSLYSMLMKTAINMILNPIQQKKLEKLLV
ncbi:MAG: hypothetical protein F6K39_18575 [Okeania sp. SIO3B3]|nr:hypothetical protein [Okeania sp. SIO3B3]